MLGKLKIKPVFLQINTTMGIVRIYILFVDQTYFCLDILKRGGNAADAAVAVAAALAVMEPSSTGPGGDAFCLFYNSSTGEVTGINGRWRLFFLDMVVIVLIIQNDLLSRSLCLQWSFTQSSDPGLPGRTWLHCRGPSFTF